MVADELPAEHSRFQPMFGHASRTGPRSRKRLLGLAGEAEAAFMDALPHQVTRTKASAVSPRTRPTPGSAAVEAVAARAAEANEALQAARDAAERLLTQARQEAAETRDEAERQRERVTAEAREETAVQVRREQQEAFARELTEFRVRLEAAREATLEGLAHEVAALVADIAEQVIYTAVEADPEATLRAVREALRELPGGGRVRVVVPEGDEQAVTGQREALLAVLREAEDLQIVPDAKLQRGGCVAYSDKGEIDARLQTRLRAVRDEIERVVV